MQAAQHAAEVPLLLRQIADRAVYAFDAGIQHGVEIEARGDENPEEEQTQGAEMAQGIVGAAEDPIEEYLDAFEKNLRVAAQDCVQAHVGRVHNVGAIADY